MANDNLPAVAAGAAAPAGELEMNDWLKKLKANQDRKKEEKLRKYNDIISKLIIVLVAVTVICFIAIAALAIENNNLYRQNDRVKAAYAQNESDLSGQIAQLTNDNEQLRQFVFSNRTSNVLYTVNMDPNLPKVSKITFDNNRLHFDFADGTSKDVYFIDSNLYVNS